MPVLGYEECIAEIKDKNSKINEVDKQIKVEENAIKKNKYQDRKEIEKCKKEIEDLKRKKDEFEKELEQLKVQVQLLGKINTKDKKICQLKEEMTECKNQIRDLERQGNEELKKCKNEIKDLKRKKDELEKEIIELNNEIEDLKKKLDENSARTDSLESKIEENKKSHQNEMEEMKEKHKKDVNKVEGNMAKRFQDLEKSHDEEIKTLDHYRTSFQMNEDQILKLEEENMTLKNELKDNKRLLRYLEKDKHKLYIGQLCAELQKNLYRYVMPESCFAEECNYKIKDIENDIKDSDVIKDDAKREEAKKNLEKLKTFIDWKKLKKLKRSIKLLEDQRNQVAHPPNVDKEGALMAAQELEKQDKLKGKTSIENVKMIIEFWSISKSLLHDENYNQNIKGQQTMKLLHAT